MIVHADARKRGFRQHPADVHDRHPQSFQRSGQFLRENMGDHRGGAERPQRADGLRLRRDGQEGPVWSGFGVAFDAAEDAPAVRQGMAENQADAVRTLHAPYYSGCRKKGKECRISTWKQQGGHVKLDKRDLRIVRGVI